MRIRETIDPVSDVPSFDQLLAIITGLLHRVSCDSMQVVLVSKATGVAQFVQIDENLSLRSEVHTALLSSAIPLGVLSWEYSDEGLSASKFLFPWVEEDEVACQVFDLICQEATEKFEEQFKRHTN